MAAPTDTPVQPYFYWTLPVSGDGRGRSTRDPARPGSPWSSTLQDARNGRFDYYDYLFQVARAAQVSGFTGAFVPWNEQGEDSWIVTAALARRIDKLTFLPELQPGFATPVYFSKLAASFQRFAGNRLGFKLDLDRDPRVRRAHGEQLEGDDFLARAGEFVRASRGVSTQHPFNLEGRFFGVEAGGLTGPLANQPHLPLYTSGRSPGALTLAAEYADVHLLDARHDANSQLRELAEASERTGRKVRAGIRLTVVARHTDEEARTEATWQGLDASAWVGSYEAIATRLDELVERGVQEFVLDSAPHVEEAYRIGEHIFPRLSERARPARQAA